MTNKIISPPGNYQRYILPAIIISLSATFYMYEYFLRVLPGVLSYEIMQDMGIHAATFSMIITSFYYGYILMQVPVGLLCDRWGPKKQLTLSIAACAIATLLFAYSNTAIISAIMRVIIGMAAASAFIAPLALTAQWYPPKYFALITGLIQLLGCVGAVGAGEPIAAVTQSVSWRACMVWSAIVGAILTLLYLLILKDSPNPDYKPSQKGSFKEELQKVQQIMANPQNWYTGVAAMSCWAPIAIFSELWGVPFLMDLQHIDNATAASEASWVWYGIAIGSPITGWLSDYYTSRKKPIIICALVGFLSSTVLFYGHIQNVLTIEVLLFCFGLAAASQVVTFGLISDNNDEKIIGTAVGFNNMAVMSGAVLQTLVGYIITIMWQGTMVNGSPVYTQHEFSYAFMIIPAISILSIVVTACAIKETHCKKALGTKHEKI